MAVGSLISLSLILAAFRKITSSCSCIFSIKILQVQVLLISVLSQTTNTFFFLSSTSSAFSTNNSTGNCPHHQKLALLQLKQGFSINRGDYKNASSRLDSWNHATDCCTWEGITCDEATGQVIGLDLSGSVDIFYYETGSWIRIGSWIEGQIDSNLFQLHSLQTLNLSWNDFYPNPIPYALDQLTNLTHLNLSHSDFIGQIPLKISRLTMLVSFDLSENRDLELRNPNLTALTANLSNLRELFLDGVNISGEHGGKWAEAMSAALPNLQKLSLRYCNLEGPIGTSLFLIPFLSQITLDENNLSMTVGPDFLGNTSALAFISLRSCNLNGKFPDSIFLLPNLEVLDISYNPDLTVHLLEFPQNSALKELYMDYTNIYEKLPESIGNLKFLKELSLSNCSLYGLLPSSIGNLSHLELLDLSNNNFSGEIPSTIGDKLQHLTRLILSGNSLEGSIPSSVFSIPSLHFLFVSNNYFSGTVGFHMFHNLKNLSSLDLSDNNISFITNNSNSHLISPSQIQYLSLRSCKINQFPEFLKNLNQLYHLDLSNNKIHGKIPSWIWKLGNWSLGHLNLSNNFLESFDHPLPDFPLSQLYTLDLHSNRLQGSFPAQEFSLSQLNFLDLHSNMLQGSLPVLSSQLHFQDYSNNNFSSVMPADMNFTFIEYFLLSNNSVSGEIPFSICNARVLEVLDLSNNNFGGTIPNCIGEITSSLKILNLRRNSFQGSMPGIFQKGCGLRTLNLYQNQLEGPIPRSLANCKTLEVLDLGNNHLNDTFPFWLKNLQSLRILILRSNKFQGPIAHSPYKYPLFPFLQIFDISSNSFMGVVPSELFLNWKAMGEENDSSLSSHDQIVRYHTIYGPYYRDSVTITMKGLDMEVVKILTALKSVDLSNNRFHGDIPKSIGNLKSLRVLNFSQNDFSGPIPVSLRNLTLLESLDLSRNKLSGKIPQQLLELTFLEVLNLSQNLLFGSIPQSRQFFSFTNDSFLGNIGLCGPPLSKKCGDSGVVPPSTSDIFHFHDVGEIDWEFMWIGVIIGFTVGFGVVFWTLALWRKGSKKYVQLIDRMQFKYCFYFSQ